MTTTPAVRLSQKYGVGTWFVNGTRDVQFTIQERTSIGLVGKDVSDSKWSVRLRVFDPADPATLVENVSLDKETTTTSPGDGGEVSGTVTIDDVHSELLFQLVLIDGDTVNAATPSGKLERPVGEPWRADCAVAGCGVAA